MTRSGERAGRGGGRFGEREGRRGGVDGTICRCCERDDSDAQRLRDDDRAARFFGDEGELDRSSGCEYEGVSRRPPTTPEDITSSSEVDRGPRADLGRCKSASVTGASSELLADGGLR